MKKPNLSTGISRRHEAKDRRINAISGSAHLPILKPISNGDEDLYSKSHPANFTKGLEHDPFGLVDEQMYNDFRDAIVSGASDMGQLDIAAGIDARKWESPITGAYFNDVGADPDAVAMPPAPKLGRSELCAEMASVYAMALTRDLSFEDLQNKKKVIPHITTSGEPVTVGDLVDELRKLSWFDVSGSPVGFKGMALTGHEKRRREAAWKSPEEGLTVDVLFRGSTKGAQQGPYISQFMMIGTKDLSGGKPTDGMISYGLQSTTQAQLVPEANANYMTTWADWLEVQQGTRFANPEHKTKRRINTPRDLTGYVHFDALYQAYLNACLILLANGGENGVEVDMGNPIKSFRSGNSTGFASWGGPHILSLVTEVATRGLRAARRTKFQVHRRARPEVMAARLAQVANGHNGKMDADAVKKIESMLKEMGFDKVKKETRPGSVLDWIAQFNVVANEGTDEAGPIHKDKNFLLPMAFIEGSPMHPAYGAGHATVAGACVTVLKAFFESNAHYADVISGGDAFYAADDTGALVASKRKDGAHATLSDELDKLAANISIGRNLAGVHYYSDYYDSLRMGERIAISMLEEQMHTYHEPVTLSLTSFDGDDIELGTTGGTGPGAVRTMITDNKGQQLHRDIWWTRDLVDYGIVDDIVSKST